MPNKRTATIVPRLRFPGFQENGAWSLIELNRLADLVQDRAGATECTPYTVTSGAGLVSQQEKLGRTIAGKSIKNYVVLLRDDFAYNKSATKAFPQGYIARYTGTDRAAVPNSIFSCFRVDIETVDPAYLDFLFQSNLHGKWLNKLIAVGARSHGSLNVSDDDLMTLPVPLPSGPTALGEQQKIADCLTSLDEVIAAQARKVEALKIYKRGLMEQLFPRDGESVPRLRFPGFLDDGDWMQTTLGDVADIRMCKRIFASETNPHRGVPFYKIGTLGGVPDAFISRKLFQEYRETFHFPRVSEVLITCSGTVGKCLQYDGEDAYFQDSNIVWIDNPRLEVTNEFLLCLLTSVDWGQLNSTTITRIYGPDLRGLAIKFPQGKSEQYRVSDYVTSLQTQILNESRLVAGLKALRTGLMQQLFPSAEPSRA